GGEGGADRAEVALLVGAPVDAALEHRGGQAVQVHQRDLPVRHAAGGLEVIDARARGHPHPPDLDAVALERARAPARTHHQLVGRARDVVPVHGDGERRPFDPEEAGVGRPRAPGPGLAGLRRRAGADAERLQLDGERAEVDPYHLSPKRRSKLSRKTMRLSSSDTGAPSIFQYSPMKSDQGSSDPKITRSPPTPCFSISTSSQRAPKPTAHEVSV